MARLSRILSDMSDLVVSDPDFRLNTALEGH